jgi:DUF1680 family protein
MPSSVKLGTCLALTLIACSSKPSASPETSTNAGNSAAAPPPAGAGATAHAGSGVLTSGAGHAGSAGARSAETAGTAGQSASAGASGSAPMMSGMPGDASSPEVPAGNCKANAFALSDVTLEAMDFIANRDRTLGYLRDIDIESLLYNFRATVGLPTGKATPPTGWEAPDSNLRGHATGHVLKALAQAYASTQDMQYKTKADALVAELKKCQDMATAKSFGAGYLGAYPPDQFIKLESLATYPTIWAPYYTMHKILAGLVASYQLTGNTTALEMAKSLAMWAHDRLSKLDHAKLQSMWNLYIAGECGGMNEVLAELYQITDDQTFLDTAALFDKDAVLDPASMDQDKLNGLHANQHIPTITGYLRIYDGNHVDKYLAAAQNFWTIVTTDHMYANGGTGEAEMFTAAKAIASKLTEKTAESCATYNMLKLTRQLFCHDPDVKYMDYYERGLYNHILGSQDPTSGDTAAVTYFIPMNPGARRTYNNTYTCCHGTGMENHTKYQEQIYSYSADKSTLYVNLYMASTLHWNDKSFTIKQETTYPYEPSTKLTFTGEGPLKVALRIPSWSTGVHVLVNGSELMIDAKPGTYAVVDNTWRSGDTLELQLPFEFRVEMTPDDDSIGAIMYGPELLVATSNKTSTISLGIDKTNLKSAFTPGSKPLTFTAGGLSFEPFSRATNVQYHTYFKF